MGLESKLPKGQLDSLVHNTCRAMKSPAAWTKISRHPLTNRLGAGGKFRSKLFPHGGHESVMVIESLWRNAWPL